MEKLHSYEDAGQALGQFSRPIGSKAYTLDTMNRFMEHIGNPQDAMNVIHVAGTSGKTSTTYYIDALLREHGYRVGMTVSPHVDVISERAQINGISLPETEYCEALTDFLELVEESKEHLSYFELLVGFAYWEFARKGVDYAVVEVGLGGLLDGTNVVNREDKISVITDIGMDHVEILGDTLEKIAAQKAGIILPHSDAFIQRQDDKVVETVQNIADQKSATLHIVEVGEESFDALPPFQARNLRLAKKVVNHALRRDGNDGVAPEALASAAQITIPARMEAVNYNNRSVILDGSHNPQKVHALVEGLQEKYKIAKIPVLVSFGQNKQSDIKNTLRELRAISDDIIITKFSLGQDEHRKAIDPEVLKGVCAEIGFERISIQLDPVVAFDELTQRDSEKLLVTGSYFLLNHIRPLVKR